MNRAHEKLLIATLAGLVITAAAAFAVSPAMAAGYHVETEAEVVGVAPWDVLNVRLWPAHYSKKVGELEPGAAVFVERCIIKPVGHDWCLVQGEYGEHGWVNSRFLEVSDDYADLYD